MSDDEITARTVEPDLLERLGRLVVKWSFVEQCVSDLFVHLTGGDRAAMIIVTSNVSQSTLTNWARALLDLRTSVNEIELADELRETLLDVDEIRRRRNALVHGLWGTDGPSNSVCVQTVRLERKEIVKDEVVTAADLDDLICEASEVERRLLSILRRARET